MYFKCKLYPTEVVVYINEDDFGVIVDHLLLFTSTPVIHAYLTEEEVKAENSNCYVELKCVR